MRNLIFIILLALPTITLAASNLPNSVCQSKELAAPSRSPNQKICIARNVYALEYSGNVLRLSYKGKRQLLEKIPKELSPSFIGAEGYIGFLPENLQIYRHEKKLLYTSVRRSRGGGGGGQCGSGAEIHLHVLDVSKEARIISSLLVGSCRRSIELQNQDLSRNVLGDISVVSGRLSLAFLNYEKLTGSPVALLSKDMKALEFKE